MNPAILRGRLMKTLTIAALCGPMVAMWSCGAAEVQSPGLVSVAAVVITPATRRCFRETR